MRTTLLCTFTNRANVELITHDIQNNYNLERRAIYMFCNAHDADELFLTYNAVDVGDFIYNTISMHRKSDYNTLYTINALNTVIRQSNNGLLDKSFIINWDNYKNSMILSSDASIRVIKLDLQSVIKN